MEQNQQPKKIKGLALFSAGLDSILAIKLVKLQNIPVEAVTFISPFFNPKDAEKYSKLLSVKLYKIDITDKLVEILKNPKYGFGKNLNPCIDCHLLIIKEAKELMKKIDADFLITGEVVGERPKSQNYNALKIIEKEAGLEGKILRPLSALKLPPTEMELKGIIKREKLLGIAGRSRVEQFKLAKELGIEEYPTPAGGCLLTVPKFADRLRVNLKLGKIDRNQLELLKLGRHFITDNNIKIIIGRNESENLKILELADLTSFIFELYNKPGPVGLLDWSEPDENLIIKTAELTSRYSKFRNEKFVEIKYYQKLNPDKFNIIRATPKDYTELNLKII